MSTPPPDVEAPAWTLDECRQRGWDAFTQGLTDGPTGLVDPKQIRAWNDGFAAAKVWRGPTWRAAFRHRVATDPTAAAKCVSWNGPPPTARGLDTSDLRSMLIVAAVGLRDMADRDILRKSLNHIADGCPDPVRVARVALCGRFEPQVPDLAPAVCSACGIALCLVGGSTDIVCGECLANELDMDAEGSP